MHTLSSPTGPEAPIAPPALSPMHTDRAPHTPEAAAKAPSDTDAWPTPDRPQPGPIATEKGPWSAGSASLIQDAPMFTLFSPQPPSAQALSANPWIKPSAPPRQTLPDVVMFLPAPLPKQMFEPPVALCNAPPRPRLPFEETTSPSCAMVLVLLKSFSEKGRLIFIKATRFISPRCRPFPSYALMAFVSSRRFLLQ